MSHFLTLVAGADYEYELAPFHEYECTDVDDEFVVDVDITDEARERYESETATLVIQRPDGTKTFAFEDGNYKDEFRPFYKNRELTLPEGYKKLRDEPAKDYETFEDWAKGYYGSLIFRDGRAFRHTNPNAKWDWYCVGGRWDGWLNGENVMCKGDVNWDAMRNEAMAQAHSLFDKIGELEPWEPFAGDRDAYWAQPSLKAVKEKLDFFLFDYDQLLVGREAYAARQANSAVAPYAFVKDRQWFEKGTMGWFGVGHNEMNQDDWNALAWQQIQNLPDDTRLTVIDCHI